MNGTTATFKDGFWPGYIAGLPFAFVVFPFGLLFGVVATEAGLNLLEVMSMTILVIAGAAQFTALALMEENAPTFVVIITALVVNMRMAIYSAGMVAHIGQAPLKIRALLAYAMVDQNYALVDAKYGDDRETPWQKKAGFFTGVFLMCSPMWISGTYIGAVFGGKIPPEFALDFALPITFLAILAPSLRSVPHYVAAFVSIIGALAFVNFPFGLGLITAALIAITAGAMTEAWMEKAP